MSTRTVRMTFTLDLMPEEELRLTIHDLLMDRDLRLTKAVYAQISENLIGVTLFSQNQLWFKQWSKVLKERLGVELRGDTVTAKSIEMAHSVILASPTVQTIYANGFSPLASTSFAAVVVSSTPSKVARTESVSSPGAAAAAAVAIASVVTAVAVPVPVPEPETPALTAPVKNPLSAFNVDVVRALRKAREFMCSKNCVSKAGDFSGIPVDEDLHTYIAKKKSIMNGKEIPIEQYIRMFIPEVMKTSRKSNFESITSLLEDDHKKVLCSLRDWYLARSWGGMHRFYLWPYSEKFTYNFKDILSEGCSVLEVHRRILSIEGLVARLTKFIYQVMSNKPNPHNLPPPVVNKTGLVLVSGSGLFGTGKDFWKLNKIMCTARDMEEFGRAKDSDFGNVIKYLMENRASAMTRHGLIAADELTWGIRLLAFFVEARDLMPKLMDKASASELWGRIQRFDENRKSVYLADLIPMIKYGDILTGYCRSLQDICKTLKPVSRQYKVEFPSDFDMAVLNHSGEIVGPSGEGLKFGHEEVASKPVVIPFPLNAAGENVVETPEAIKDKFDAYYLWENSAISRMIEDLGIDPGEEGVFAMQKMRIAHENLKKIFNNDSHVSNNTFVLPPTASLPMPLANYMPHKIYEK